MELGNQFASAIVASMLLDYLKHSGWFPWLSPDSVKRLKVICGASAAALATAGIVVTFDYDIASGGGASLTLPPVHVLWDFAKQWALQEFVYRTQQRHA